MCGEMSNATAFNSRFMRIINSILLLFSSGCCLFIISVINTKDTYLAILMSSNKENSSGVISLANTILSTPIFALMIFCILALIGKELLLKSFFTKLMFNTASALVLLVFSILVLKIISYPIV